MHRLSATWSVLTRSLALLIVAVSPALAREGNGALKPARLDESLRESPMISGARLAGYAVPEAPGAARTAFRAWLPAGMGGSALCLRVVAADALYEARGVYEVPADQPAGAVLLDFDSRYGTDFWQSRAVELGADGVAVLLTEGACPGTEGTDARPGRAVPVLATTEATAEATAEATTEATTEATAPVPALLVNSFRAEQSFVFVDGLTDPTPCERIAAPVRTAFDTRCELALPSEVAADTPLTATVLTIRGGEMGPPIEVPLWPLPRR